MEYFLTTPLLPRDHFKKLLFLIEEYCINPLIAREISGSPGLIRFDAYPLQLAQPHTYYAVSLLSRYLGLYQTKLNALELRDSRIYWSARLFRFLKNTLLLWKNDKDQKITHLADIAGIWTGYIRLKDKFNTEYCKKHVFFFTIIFAEFLSGFSELTEFKELDLLLLGDILCNTLPFS